MCSILITNVALSDEIVNSPLLVNRGPDLIEQVRVGRITFLHYLLNVTGEIAPQPMCRNEIVGMFNGELYNFHDSPSGMSEIEMLLEAYEASPDGFYNDLDGEYAICITDFKKNRLIILTDPFGTKPIYYAVADKKFGVSTYKEPLYELGFLDAKRCAPSSLYSIDLDTLAITRISDIQPFDLRQYKSSYDDWCEAFLDAVRKRFFNVKYDVILPLSSGHDSGAIACAMEVLKIAPISYTYWGHEHRAVLRDRLDRISDMPNAQVFEYSHEQDGRTLYRLSEQDKAVAQEIMVHRCAMFGYGPDLQESTQTKVGTEDVGAQGLCFLLNSVKNKNSRIRILASGQGGDEIMGNLPFYGFPKPNPKEFPLDLSSAFPWPNFYYGAQSSYLSRDEAISGGLGIEGRYALLDAKLVQEFLALKSELKNKYYKAPLTHFMEINDYAYVHGEGIDVKRGFNV